MAQGLCATALRLFARPAARELGGTASYRQPHARLRVISRGFAGDLSRSLGSSGPSRSTFEAQDCGTNAQFSATAEPENVALLPPFASDEELIQYVTGILMSTQQWRELDGKLANLGDQVKAQHVPEILKRAHTSEVLFNFFDWVRARKQIQLDISIFHLMFSILSSKERPEEMQWLLVEMHAAGLKAESSMFIWVMQSFARLNRVPDACRLFWKMEGLDCSPDITAYNAILRILLDLGNTHDFEMINSSLKFSGTTYDATTYEIMLEKACKTGRPDEAYRLFEQMKLKLGRAPLNAYSLLSECLKKSGQEQLAMEVWKSRPNPQ